MKTRFLFLLLTFSSPWIAFCQQVGIGTATPHSSALMDVSSTTKGMLVPRMTSAQRMAIASPASGLLVYDTNEKGFMFYNGTVWTAIGSSDTGGVFKVTNGQVHNTGDINSNNFIFGRSSLPQANESVEDKFMFFQKDKGALRAGGVVQETFSWAPENIGTFSTALGHNNIASGISSVALGGNNSATGAFSIAMGNYANAKGSYSTAIGNATTASGPYSFSGGFHSESLESSSFAFGTQIRASGVSSTVFGTQNIAKTFASFVIGRYNDTLNGSAANWVETDPLFMIGNGASNADRRNAMTVLKNGNTGIGTSQPVTSLHISRDGSQAYGQLLVEETGSNNDGARITFKNKFDNSRYWDLYGFPGIDNSGPARFTFHYSGFRDVMTLSGLGYVGIGNSNPTAFLDIESNSSGTWPQFRARANTADYVRMRMSNTVHTNSYWDIASITSNTTTPNAYMNFFYSHNGGGSNILSLQGNGNAFLLGTLTQNSDERLKKNITAIENPMDALSQLSGYHYQWKDEWRDSTIQTGLIAQEVEKVMPELVKEDEKGIKSVNYNGLVPYLLEAIKTLKAELDEIKAGQNKTAASLK